jgi:hypothetical protein
VALVEVAGCVFDADQLGRSRGYEALDPVGREAFVNHLHLTSADRAAAARRVIAGWASEMRARWPGSTFRVYQVVEPDEVTVRFHLTRPGVADWCQQGDTAVDVFTVGPGESAAEPARAPDCGGGQQ